MKASVQMMAARLTMVMRMCFPEKRDGTLAMRKTCVGWQSGGRFYRNGGRAQIWLDPAYVSRCGATYFACAKKSRQEKAHPWLCVAAARRYPAVLAGKGAAETRGCAAQTLGRFLPSRL
ncbi:MAG TPA: hypothetical protein VFM56_08815, partial [Solimonas sp.]|nr:hypothetical protein [Solimonas sp.]